MNNLILRQKCLAGLTGLFLLIISLFPVSLGSETRLPVLGNIEPFELLDSQKEEFSSGDLEGKIWLVNFFFTNCPGICPLMTSKIAKIHREFEAEQNLKIVSITLDPMRDGPTALRAYAEKYKADTSRWHFLTGSNDVVEDVLLNKFKMKVEEVSVSHTDNVFLVDQELNIRGRFSGLKKEELLKLRGAVKELLKEKTDTQQG